MCTVCVQRAHVQMICSHLFMYTYVYANTNLIIWLNRTWLIIIISLCKRVKDEVVLLGWSHDWLDQPKNKRWLSQYGMSFNGNWLSN
jgi:hypothetical protein